MKLRNIKIYNNQKLILQKEYQFRKMKVFIWIMIQIWIKNRAYYECLKILRKIYSIHKELNKLKTNFNFSVALVQ